MTPAGIFVFVVAFCVTAYAVAGIYFRSGDLDAAIVIVQQVEARRAPAERAALADVLPAGSRVRVLEERSGWAHCELPAGDEGWLPVAAIGRVWLAP
jgi:hypothetical protein